MVLIDVLESFKMGNLYASQDWVNGIPGREEPVVYSVPIGSRMVYIVGDGHKRIASSILGDKPMGVRVDLEVKPQEERILKDPDYAAQKLAYLGIEGMWPFSGFIQKYVTNQS